MGLLSHIPLSVVLAAGITLSAGCSSPPQAQLSARSDASIFPGDRLSALLALNLEEMVPEPKNLDFDWERVFDTSRSNAVKLESYCSKSVLYAYGKIDHDTKDSVASEWRLDFSSPDKWHVFQAVWDTEWKKYLYDEWVLIGDTQYSNVGFWNLSDDPYRSGLNPILGIGATQSEILKNGFLSADTYKHLNQSYVVLRFDLDLVSGTGESRNCIQLGFKCEKELWIDQRSGILVKSVEQYRLLKQIDEIDSAWVQVYSGFNEDIKVRPPKKYNVKSSADGHYELMPGTKENVPFHDC